MSGDKLRLLITGGAGYIGCHVAYAALDAGHEVVVLDNLSTGIKSQIPAAARFVHGDIDNSDALADALDPAPIDAVIHLAAHSLVGQSLTDPLGYYHNNLCASTALIAACAHRKIGYFIFSSTAAVYAVSEDGIVHEDSPTQPISPYGKSKFMVEEILRDLPAVCGMQHAILRYFNVAGADPQGRCGQSTRSSTHLLKAACEMATGKRNEMVIHGDDYDTPDGTCVRDYIHVTDIAEAHLAALTALRSTGRSTTLNCGTGQGFSVRQVLSMVGEVTQKPLNIRVGPRRAGDQAQTVACADRIREMGWQPRHSDLRRIIQSALDWEQHLLST